MPLGGCSDSGIGIMQLDHDREVVGEFFLMTDQDDAFAVLFEAVEFFGDGVQAFLVERPEALVDDDAFQRSRLARSELADAQRNGEGHAELLTPREEADRDRPGDSADRTIRMSASPSFLGSRLSSKNSSPSLSLRRVRSACTTMSTPATRTSSRSSPALPRRSRNLM